VGSKEANPVAKKSRGRRNNLNGESLGAESGTQTGRECGEERTVRESESQGKKTTGDEKTAPGGGITSGTTAAAFAGEAVRVGF